MFCISLVMSTILFSGTRSGSIRDNVLTGLIFDLSEVFLLFYLVGAGQQSPRKLGWYHYVLSSTGVGGWQPKA